MISCDRQRLLNRRTRLGGSVRPGRDGRGEASTSLVLVSKRSKFLPPSLAVKRVLETLFSITLHAQAAIDHPGPPMPTRHLPTPHSDPTRDRFLLTLCATALEARRDRMADCIFDERRRIRCRARRLLEKEEGGERRKREGEGSGSIRGEMGGDEG
jgi:hypothetical protein